MTENEVPATRTIVTPQAMFAALQIAWKAMIPDSAPSRASLLVLLSQWHLETGGGGQCLDWNCAGIRWTPGCGHDYASYTTREGPHGETIEEGQRFRAYATMEAGVSDWLRVLRTTFGFAWPAVEDGSLDEFSHRLKTRGYYTLDEGEYTRRLQGRWVILDAAIPKDATPSLADTLAAVRATRDVLGPVASVSGDEPPEAPEESGDNQE